MQFTLSIVLIVAVFVVYQQIRFVQSQNLGYNKDQVLYFSREGKVAENAEGFLTEVRNIPGVVDASTVVNDFIGSINSTPSLQWEGKLPDDEVSFFHRAVDYDALEALDIELIAGRSFSRDYNDTLSAIILNEAAIKHMGLSDPLGQTVELWGRGDGNCWYCPRFSL